MAYTMRLAVKVTFTIEDKSDTSTCSFYLGDASGALPDPNDVNVRNFLTEFASSLQNVSDCRVLDISMTYTMLQDTFAAFGAQPDVERKGVLQFATADGFQTIFTIPGIKETAIAANGTDIIRSSTVNGAFDGNPLETHFESIHDKLRNGATSGVLTYPVVDRRRADLRDLLDAYKQHRRNPRG